MSWADVDAHLGRMHRLQPSNAAVLLSLLEGFVAADEDPSRSPNYKNQDADSLGRLVFLLKDPGIEQQPVLALAALKALKVLTRKQCNHLGMRRDEKKEGNAIKAVLRFLQDPGKVDERIASEAANVLMNACYASENVTVMLQNEGCIPPLVAFLGAADTDLQANVAGVLQSVCFPKEGCGRDLVRDGDAIPPLLALLASDNLKVRTRAAGALHNISSSVQATGIIRRKNGILPIVKLLRSPHAAIAQSAAGALQNIGREEESRKIIRSDNDAVAALFAMLVDGKETTSQVSAAGALLNILGPVLTKKGKSDKEKAADRKGFARNITSCLVISKAYDGVFGVGGVIAASVR